MPSQEYLIKGYGESDGILHLPEKQRPVTGSSEIELRNGLAFYIGNRQTVLENKKNHANAAKPVSVHRQVYSARGGADVVIQSD